MLIKNFFDKIDRAIEEKKNFVYYLIGNNGTGKSRILNALSNSVIEKPRVTKSICISNTLYDKFKPLDKKEIYLGLRTVNNAIFFTAVEKTICDLLLKCMKNKTLHLLEKDLGITFSIKLTKNEKKHKITTYFDNRKLKNNHLNKFLDEGDENEIMSIAGQIIKFDMLTEKQQKVIDKFLTLNPNNLNLISEKKGVNFTFEQLSSGEQNRILLSAKILSYICNDSVILIDEPEVSLHLHWQVEFHKSLNSFIENLKV
ncbi:AAA family ATPase [Pantoea agglomerans]|uniref:AAA family ATPase n=1 Tax=Enterobacter agglomerans TaxID=549 RepID=UPI0037C9842E